MSKYTHESLYNQTERPTLLETHSKHSAIKTKGPSMPGGAIRQQRCSSHLHSMNFDQGQT